MVSLTIDNMQSSSAIPSAQEVIFGKRLFSVNDFTISRYCTDLQTPLPHCKVGNGGIYMRKRKERYYEMGVAYSCI